MSEIINIIVEHSKKTIIIFLIITAISAVLLTGVGINTNNAGYLPDHVNSKQAFNLLRDEFGINGTAQVMIKSDDVLEIKAFKEKLKIIEGVDSIIWLDDVIDIYIPIKHINENYLDLYYKDGYALMQVKFTHGNDQQPTYDAIKKITQILKGDGYIAGAAVDSLSYFELTKKQIPIYMTVAVLLILVILIFSTQSWLEPFLFLFTIGVAIIINMGLNIFSGEISNVTQSAAAILQLAVSMDYAIFLLHRFHQERTSGKEVKAAMIQAVKKSMPSILGSALTTIGGFLALLVMGFGIGREMGFVLARGIAISFLTVMILLPAIVVFLDNWIEKFMHKTLLPDFKPVARFSIKFRWVAVGLLVIFGFIFFMAGNNLEFYYSDPLPENNLASISKQKIEEVYGTMTPNIILLPGNDLVKQKKLEDDLLLLEGVDSVVSMYTQTGTQMHQMLLPDYLLNQFKSDNYSQIFLYMNVAENDSPEAFRAVESIRNVLDSHYHTWYIAGETFSYYDLKQISDVDNTRSSLLAIVLIMLVIAVVFKSAGIPIVAVLIIQAAVYINLGISYFMGTPTSFISSIIINAIQLGATIDYAILYIFRYKEMRSAKPPLDAAKQALAEVFPSILTSAAILVAATFSIYFISSMAAASEMCLLIGRGAIISLACVTLVLPGLLAGLDKLIQKTSFGWLNNVSKRDIVE